MNSENYDPSFPDQPVVDLYLPIWANLPGFKSKPAFIWAKDCSSNANNHQNTKSFTTLTYSQLNNSVQTISTNLLLQLSRRDSVIILCSPGLDLIEVIFGCQRAGLLIIPIFPPTPSFQNNNYHHLIRAISQTKPKAAIAHQNYITNVQNYISSSSPNHKLTKLITTLKWISTEEIKANVLTSSPKNSSNYKGCGPDEVYLIQYTSGTTGIPKPVLVTSGAAVHNVRVARKSYDVNPNSVIVSWLPQYHDCGLQFLLLNIISGATSVLTSPIEFINRPSIWLELISEFNGSCTPVTSFTLPLVVKRGRDWEGNGSKVISLWSLKNLILINEPIYKASVEEFVDIFRPFGLNPSCISPSYGLAENCTFVSTSWRICSSGNFVCFPSYKKLLPSARLYSFKNVGENDEEEMEIIVVNEDTCEIVDDGIEGEIWVSSPSNCSGYLGHPNLTREIFQARVKNKISKCFVRTGDRGVIKGEERYLYVIGRCFDVIKLPNNEGEVHPHYIETTTQSSCPSFIRGGCIAAFEIENVLAIVAELQRNEMEVKVLKGICEGIRKAVVEEEGVEVGLVVLVKSGSVPKTTSGKVKRWAAKDMFVSGVMKVAYEVKFDGGNVVSDSSLFRVGSKGRGGGEGTRNIVGEDGEDHKMLLVSLAGSTRIDPPLRSPL